MFLEKIKSGESGILTYGITPPKSTTSSNRVAEIAEKTIGRLNHLNLDALIVYDVQDEAARTPAERPFPFIPALDPFEFASQYLQELKIPKIIYRPAGKFSKSELSEWLSNVNKHGFYPVFVGLPAVGHPVKTTLNEAYQLWNKYTDSSVMGAITIPERHETLKDEDRRILDKTRCGVSYFISQCVFNVGYARKVIEDLSRTCLESNIKPPTIIFTLAVCGSEKTMSFMEWLGIHLPESLKQEFLIADNMLERSVHVCLDVASELTAFCQQMQIPFGFNIESVAIRNDEIEASIFMVNKIASMLKRNPVINTARVMTY